MAGREPLSLAKLELRGAVQGDPVVVDRHGARLVAYRERLVAGLRKAGMPEE